MLRVQDLTLEKAPDVVRPAEATERHLKELENEPAVHGIEKGKTKPSFRKKKPSDSEKKRPPIKMFNCRNCGTRHSTRKCSAYGETCHN